MESELLYPLVPVALVKLGAVRGVSEQSGSLTDLGSQGLIESSEAAWSKLVPDAGVPIVLRPGQLAEDGGPVLCRPGDGRHSLSDLLPSPALLLSKLTDWLSQQSVGQWRSADI